MSLVTLGMSAEVAINTRTASTQQLEMFEQVECNAAVYMSHQSATDGSGTGHLGLVC